MARKRSCPISEQAGTSSVPYLVFYCLAVDNDGLGLKFDADGGLGVDRELVLLKATQKVALSNPAVCVRKGGYLRSAQF